MASAADQPARRASAAGILPAPIFAAIAGMNLIFAIGLPLARRPRRGAAPTSPA